MLSEIDLYVSVHKADLIGWTERCNMGLAQAFKRDIGLKIAALLLAIFLWFNVSEQKEIEAIAEIGIRFINMPSGLTFASEPPVAAKVRVRGKGKFFRWRLKDLAVVIDLSPASLGTVTHLLSASEVLIPKNRQIEVLEIIEPKAVRIDLDRIVTKGVPVEIRLMGQLPDDKKMIGKPQAIPQAVRLSGPRKMIDGFHILWTEPVDLAQLGKKGKVTVAPDLSDHPLVGCNVDEIEIVARIEPRKSLEVPSVPIMLISAPGVKSKITPDSLDILISGGQTQIDSLSPEKMLLLLDVSSLGKGVFELRSRVSGGNLVFDVKSVKRGDEAHFIVPARLDIGFEIDILGTEPDTLDLVRR